MPLSTKSFALGTVIGGVGVAAVVAIAPLLPFACSAVGYVDVSPIALVLPAGTPATVEVAACFTPGCTPVPVTADAAGTFLVPQDAPYLDFTTADVGRAGVYVYATVGGVVAVDSRFLIPTASDSPTPSRCAGPFHYLPVQLA